MNADTSFLGSEVYAYMLSTESWSCSFTRTDISHFVIDRLVRDQWASLRFDFQLVRLSSQGSLFSSSSTQIDQRFFFFFFFFFEGIARASRASAWIRHCLFSPSFKTAQLAISFHGFICFSINFLIILCVHKLLTQQKGWQRCHGFRYKHVKTGCECNILTECLLVNGL